MKSRYASTDLLSWLSPFAGETRSKHNIVEKKDNLFISVTRLAVTTSYKSRPSNGNGSGGGEGREVGAATAF